MNAGLLAVQQMTEGMRSSGLEEVQANAVVQAIAEGVKAFSVTPEVLRQELAPFANKSDGLEARLGQLENRLERLETRVDALHDKVDALVVAVDTLSSRMFWLTITLLGTMGAMLAAMASVLFMGAG